MQKSFLSPNRSPGPSTRSRTSWPRWSAACRLLSYRWRH